MFGKILENLSNQRPYINFIEGHQMEALRISAGELQAHAFRYARPQGKSFAIQALIAASKKRGLKLQKRKLRSKRGRKDIFH